MLNSFETTFTSSQHPCPVTKEIPQALFLFLISLVSLWSDAGDQWLSPTLGPVGRPQMGNRYSVWESSDSPQISLIHLRWLCDSGAEMILIRGQRATRRRYTLYNPLWYPTVIHIAGSNLLCGCSDIAKDGEGEHGRWFIGTKAIWNGRKDGPAWDKDKCAAISGWKEIRKPFNQISNQVQLSFPTLLSSLFQHLYVRYNYLYLLLHM